MPIWDRLAASHRRSNSALALAGRKERSVQIKQRQKMLVIGAIAVVAIFAGDKLILAPLTSAWDARAARIKVLRNQLSRGKMLVQRETGIRNHWDEMQKRSLTKNTSAAEQQVFRAIDGWAQ